MSLRVWLPLNGDLRNQGLSPLPSPTVDVMEYESGKIGAKCGVGRLAWHLTEDFLDNTWSIAMWVKPDSLGSTNNVLFCKNIKTSSDCQIYFSIISNTQLNLGVNGPSTSISKTGLTFTLGDWYHVAATYDGTTAVLYLNGEEVKRGNVTTAKPIDRLNINLNGRSTNNNNTTVTGQASFSFNDFRIYDHALSEKEVKEIAKGLILHYKLDNNGQGGRNLLFGTNKSTYLTALNTTNERTMGLLSGGSGGNGKFSVVYDPTVPVGNYAYTITNNTSGNRDFQQGGIPFVAGQKYTGSWWAKGTGTCLFRSWNRTKSSRVFQKTFTLTNEWKFYSYTFTATAAQETDDCTWHLGVSGKSSIQIAGMKLEVGNKATIYSSAPEDYNFSTNIIEDCSGYGHHGIAVNNLIIDQNSAKYDVSTFFSNSSYIKYTNFNLPVNTWTVSCWYYKNANPTAYETIYCLSKNTGADADKKFAAQPNAGRIWFKVESGSRSINKLAINEWTLLTISCNGTTGTIYENLTPIGTINAGNMMVDCTDLVLGAKSRGPGVSAIGVPYNGYISDFRIYCTALSADDIKELYQTSASIDDKQNFYSRELSNSLHDTTSITQAGITLADDFVEDAVAAIKDDRSIESNCFYEY